MPALLLVCLRFRVIGDRNVACVFALGYGFRLLLGNLDQLQINGDVD